MEGEQLKCRNESCADKWKQVSRLKELLADGEQQVCRAVKRQMQTVARVDTLALLSSTEEKRREQTPVCVM